MHRSVAHHLTALGLFAVAALALTWPLPIHIATHVAGDGIDDPSLAWNLWWIKFQLVDQVNWNIYHADWMFHPISINLAFYTLTPLNGLLSVPLQVVFSETVASNLILLSSFILSAYGMYLLALYIQTQLSLSLPAQDLERERLVDYPVIVAFFSGLMYAFASAKLFYASLGQFNIASSQWIPFAALYIVRLHYCTNRRSAVRTGLMAGFFIILQAWAELTFASFLLIFFALAAIWWAITRLQTGDNIQPHRAAVASFGVYLTGVFAAAVVFLLGIAPFLGAMLPDLRSQGDLFARGGGFVDQFSADLMGYLVPTILHPLFGDFSAQLPFPNDKGQHIYLGYLVLLLALIGVYGFGIRRRYRSEISMVWFWVICAVVFWALTLGPQVRWAGNSLGIPGPFALVSQLPFFSGNRYPSRYSVMLLLSVASLTVFGLRYLLLTFLNNRRFTALPDRSSVNRVAIVAVGAASLLMLFEHLSVPLPLSDFRTPQIYHTLAQEQGDFTVLELPTGWRNGARVLGRSDVLIMMQQWYQTTHGKRRLGGNTSRNPPIKFQYFTDAPLTGDLIALMNADRPHLTNEIAAQYAQLVDRNLLIASDVLDFLGVEYVLVHEEHAPEQLLNFIRDVLPLTLVETWQGADWMGAPSTIRLYAVEPSRPPAEWQANLASKEGRLYLAEGWSSIDVLNSPFRYATTPKSTLLLDLPNEGGTLSLELADGAEVLELTLNGHPLSDITQQKTGTMEIHIAPGIATALVDRLTIHWAGEPVPLEKLAQEADSVIGETGYALAEGVAVAVLSAGEEVGDFAHIFVNGIDYAQNTRGYNVVALTTEGQVLDSRGFDTHGDEAASRQMAEWLEQWPAGTVIAGAIADEGSYLLQDIAVQALHSIGVEYDMRNRFRWGHAFITVVDASPGTASEDARLIEVTEVAIGPPLDAPAATGGVGVVGFRQHE